jgi:protein-S-isoprenylcysteine O-methyltransferase Ste14
VRFSLLSQYVPMNLETGQFIAVCWGIFGVVWIIAAFFTKRTAEHSMSFWRLVWIAAIVGLVATAGRNGGDMWDKLPKSWDWTWGYTPDIGFAADAIVALGLLITLWARFTLGTNWSGSVTFKENHELITSGPYAFVRHPIYTGLLTMLLGTVIITGHAFGFAVLALGTVMLWLKSLDEERMMTKHFPDAYPPYKRRVAALIPFIL